MGSLSPQELLAEWQLQQGPRSVWGRLRQVAILGFVWLLCLGTTLGCTLAVYAFSELMIKVRGGSGQPLGALAGTGSPPRALCDPWDVLPVPSICLAFSPPRLLFSRFLWVSLFFFRHLCPFFLCGLNTRPGVEGILGEGGAARQFPPPPSALCTPPRGEPISGPGPVDGASVVTTAPRPALVEPSVC